MKNIFNHFLTAADFQAFCQFAELPGSLLQVGPCTPLTAWGCRLGAEFHEHPVLNALSERYVLDRQHGLRLRLRRLR